MAEGNEENKEIFSLRVWTKFELAKVRKNLLLIDDLYGTCANCSQIGLNYTKDKTCKNCKTKFQYLATKQKKISEISKILNRIQKDKLELTLIDRDDFDYFEGKAKAQDLFQ